ncbi:ABC transporter permease [Bacillus sp. BRMEA1]|uniref:ABC transporter permease n=1 Tax=Neobacillus endophyticus TaxID=2738405 RepID=UPI0015653B4D|nr:ABC transporter permease [Neobacillus endophyticus]NRD76728.1 ABC transporter permease [Neobacillus endophyticus]
MSAFLMQCKTEIIRVTRNRYFVFWSLAMPILFYYIFTNVVHINAPNKAEWQAHYLMSMAAFSVMGSSIMTLGIRLVQERAQGWSTFIRITPLSDNAYFAAQMVGQSFIHLLSITIIFLAGKLINGVSLTAFEWLMSGLWLLFASLPLLALGTLIGLMKKVETAAGVSNVLYMVLAVSGGLWMPLEAMPKMMQTIGKWLPSYNFGSGAWEIVSGGTPEWKNILILIAYLTLFMLLSRYIRRKQEAV